MLHMLQAVLPPIVRSSNLCIQHRVLCQTVKRKTKLTKDHQLDTYERKTYVTNTYYVHNKHMHNKHILNKHIHNKHILNKQQET